MNYEIVAHVFFVVYVSWHLSVGAACPSVVC